MITDVGVIVCVFLGCVTAIIIKFMDMYYHGGE